MNDYIELRLDVEGATSDGENGIAMETVTDVLAAMLADEGYESFCPDDKGLTAYIRKDDFSGEKRRSLLRRSRLPASPSRQAPEP